MIIGLSGYAQSGKDYTAHILVNEYGYERRAFADPIRKVLYDVNPHIYIGYDIETTLQLMVDNGGWDEAKRHPDVRKGLQSLGMAMRKHLGDRVWVNAALATLDLTKNYVFSDVRFPNEADAIKDLGGQIWRVHRTGVAPVNGHPSEIAMDGYPSNKHLVSNSNVKEQIESFLDDF